MNGRSSAPIGIHYHIEDPELPHQWPTNTHHIVVLRLTSRSDRQRPRLGDRDALQRRKQGYGSVGRVAPRMRIYPLGRDREQTSMRTSTHPSITDASVLIRSQRNPREEVEVPRHTKRDVAWNHGKTGLAVLEGGGWVRMLNKLNGGGKRIRSEAR